MGEWQSQRRGTEVSASKRRKRYVRQFTIRLTPEQSKLVASCRPPERSLAAWLRELAVNRARDLSRGRGDR